MSDSSAHRHRSAHAGPRRPAPPGPPEPSHAERARTLIHLGDIGTLSSQSKHSPGWPFGSLTPYALDALGQPLLLISGLAMHTQNLRAEPRCSLLISEATAGRDPLGLGRVTLLAEAVKIESEDREEAKEIYLAAHANAKHWVDYGDFAFYRLEVQQVYFVGGFGVMGWVEGADYRGAAPDPLAESAGHIIDHMNADHADALRLIAESTLEEPVAEATMTAVDRLGFHARLMIDDHPRGVRINFPNPAEDSEAARHELVAMVKEARARQ